MGDDLIGHFEKKKVYLNMCRILNGYRDTDHWTYTYKSIVNDNNEREDAYYTFTLSKFNV